MAPGIQERVLGDRAGGDHPDDLAADDRLGPPFSRFRRVFGLFADGDPEPLADEFGQIRLVTFHRHPAHWNIAPQMPAPLGQGDVQRFRRRHRVIEKKLVEIPHAVEQQAIGMIVLDGQILVHHRRRLGGVVTGRGGGEGGIARGVRALLAQGDDARVGVRAGSLKVNGAHHNTADKTRAMNRHASRAK